MSNNNIVWKNCKRGDVIIATGVLKGLNDNFMTLNKEYIVLQYYACCDLVDFIGDDKKRHSIHISRLRLK